MKIYELLLLISLSKIVFPQCVNFRNYCSKCDPKTNLCAICAKKDIFVPDQKGGCKGIKKCTPGKNYCAECEGKDGELCEKCDEGLYPDENGGCSNTNYCSISYNGECLKCIEDYVLLGDSSKFKYCKSKFSDDFLNCARIDTRTGFCSRCENDYFLNAGDGKCIKTENCYESVFGNCIKCIPGFYYDKKEDKCVEYKKKLLNCQQTIDGKKCDICNDNYYLDENGDCTFSNFCSESENGVCTECIEGYHLANNSICTNTENCFHADKDLGVCLNCENHFYLDKKDYKCKSNEEDSKFKYCLIADKECTTCEWTYYLGKDSKCCNTRFCEESEDGICTLCEEGYEFQEDDNLCVPSEDPEV